MVALVERDGFCIKADSLLKVSCLAGGVALTDLNIKLSSEIGIQKKIYHLQVFMLSISSLLLTFSRKRALLASAVADAEAISPCA